METPSLEMFVLFKKFMKEKCWMFPPIESVSTLEQMRIQNPYHLRSKLSSLLLYLCIIMLIMII